jgi:integrase
MLIAHVERYIALRRSLGFQLRSASRRLRSFARFAAAQGDTHVRAATAVTWAATASTPNSRHVWLIVVVQLSRFLRAEDADHEVPPTGVFAAAPRTRPAPYIYTPDELARILEAAANLRPQKPSPLRRHVYVMLFGLIAATGLRVAEALNLRLVDVLPGGILHIGQAKFKKSRLVPMHPSVAEALDRYLDVRRHFAGADDHVFLTTGGKPLGHGMAHSTFQLIRKKAGIAPDRSRRPRIHDLRHSFATRVLERCATRRDAVARNFVALHTYLGHANIADTYWYLEASPDLMQDIAKAAEAHVAGEVA